MDYKRIFVRVPITGEAVLSSSIEPFIKARTIDISKGGLAVSEPSDSLKESEYAITVTTTTGNKIEFTGKLIRESADSIGFKTIHIDKSNLSTISNLVYQYQETTDFIKQVDEHDLFDQLFIDEDGTELEVTFDIDPKE